LTGATVVNLSPATAEELGLEPHFKGVAVARLDNRSAARNLGLRRGDIVLAVNDQKISTTRDLERALNARQRYWQLTIQRGEEVVNVMVGG
jgi:S1-C subfamily serine protease